MAKNRFSLVVVPVIAAIAIGFMSEDVNASSFKIIYSFQGGADGVIPQGPLVEIKGTLYGSTAAGGSGVCHCGTIFSLTPAGIESVVYSFQHNGDGSNPTGLVNAHKAIFGVSVNASGGINIFSVTPTGKFRVLATSADFVWPTARHPLVQIGDTWYGVNTGTSYTNCANNACGYIFALTP